MLDLNEHHDTNESSYSPWSLLPSPEPSTYSPPLGYFYHNVAKHLIKDTVRLMANGLHIDLDKVEQLESTLDEQLLKVQQDLASNPLIDEFQRIQHRKEIEAYIVDRKSKMRNMQYYIKQFNYKDIVHRSYFMYFFAQEYKIPLPTELLEGSTVPKWSAKLVSTFASSRPVLQRLLNGTLMQHPLIDKAITLLATHKCDMYNEKYLTAIQSPDVPVPIFNPGSSQQKQALFSWLGIEADKLSKTTGLPSFDRSVIERINKETIDDNVRHFTQCFIEYSFAAIVRDNFIAAFYKYTIDGRLYGQYKLLGAKSGRYTSSNPNMLNAPSTKSAFAKPIKRCFTAPEGFVIAAIDYAALEDRVMASLSRDTNKCAVFTDGVDGHSLGALAYYPDECAQELPPSGNLIEDAKQFKQMVDNGNEPLTKLRQLGKNCTFGLSYGAYPPKVAATLKCSLGKATEIFNNYHNVLYPGVTDYRENYVLPTTREHGRLHLGLGFYIKTDNPDKDIRTTTNASCQFWSLLTALTINKLHHLIDEAGYQQDIIITSSIYDSIYFEVRANPTVIQWLNANIIPVMTTDFMFNQTIKNEANLEIGTSWADLHALPIDASLDEITTTMESLCITTL